MCAAIALVDVDASFTQLTKYNNVCVHAESHKGKYITAVKYIYT
jgi:hypothetical protein